MKQQTDRSLDIGFLSGGGELGQLIREFDWAATPLGAPHTWPQNLRMALRIMLTSRQPMWIGWGNELFYSYNEPNETTRGIPGAVFLRKPYDEQALSAALRAAIAVTLQPSR